MCPTPGGSVKGVRLDRALRVAGFRQRERLPVARTEEKSGVGSWELPAATQGIWWGAWGPWGEETDVVLPWVPLLLLPPW